MAHLCLIIKLLLIQYVQNVQLQGNARLGMVGARGVIILTQKQVKKRPLRTVRLFNKQKSGTFVRCATVQRQIISLVRLDESKQNQSLKLVPYIVLRNNSSRLTTFFKSLI